MSSWLLRKRILEEGSYIDTRDLGEYSETTLGEWPESRALPNPAWAHPRQPLTFDSVKEFELFTDKLTHHLQENLNAHCYDTLSNFIRLCQEYVGKCEGFLSVAEFFRVYDPPIIPASYTCVGLACDLMVRCKHLEDKYPGFQSATYLVSCEEKITNVNWYCSTADPPTTSEKEHVLVCIKIDIAGRSGVVLLDSGYHVGSTIIVMQDGEYPQSETIRSSTTNNGVCRTYRYAFWPDNPSYVAWYVSEKQLDQKIEYTSLILVDKPFLSSLDVAERRNLVFPFKTLLSRDSSGNLTGGLYFPLKHISKANITLFYRKEGTVTKTKIPVKYFQGESERDEIIERFVSEVIKSLGWQYQDLRETLGLLADILSDTDLMAQLEEYNDAVDLISTDN